MMEDVRVEEKLSVVVDDDGFHGTIVEKPADEQYGTDRHVWVKVAKNHPLAYLGKPIPYAVDRLRKTRSKIDQEER